MSAQTQKAVKALAGMLAVAEPSILAEAVEMARDTYVASFAQTRAIILLARACGHRWATMAWTSETFDGSRSDDHVLHSIFYDQERWDGTISGLWAHAHNDVFVDILNEEGYDTARAQSTALVNCDWPRSTGLDFATLRYPRTAEFTVDLDGEPWDFPMQGQIQPGGGFFLYIGGATSDLDDRAPAWIVRATDEDPLTVVIKVDDDHITRPIAPDPEVHEAVLAAFRGAGFTVKEEA